MSYVATFVTLALGLKIRLWWRALATCCTNSFLIPSSSSCFGSTLITPTSVVFISSIPSVNTDIE